MARIRGLNVGAGLSDPLGTVTGTTNLALKEYLVNGIYNSQSTGLSAPLAKSDSPRNDNSPDAPYIYFPPTLQSVDSYILFDLKKYQMELGAGKGNIRQHIALPLPSNLSEQFDMKYNDVAIGALLGDASVRSAISSGVQAASSGKTPEERTAAAKSMVSNLGDAMQKVKESALPLIALEAAKAISDGAGAIASQVIGGVPNPNMALLYQSHGFRSFQFNWRLIPISPDEAKTVKKIVQWFRHAMHPSKKGLFLEFPYQSDVYIKVKGRDLFKIKPCVIKGFTVNYAPSGQPAFYNDGEPLEIDISISLQETEIFTQEDFEIK